MNTIRNRAKEQLPVVLLTLLSIVQALALELLWGYIREADYLYEAGWPALLGWVQVATTFLGILLIWLIYASSVMRFRWVPTTADSVFPFVIGVVEFTLVEVMGPDQLGLWFLTMALIFTVTTLASHLSYRRARADGENEEFFRHMAPATLRDFVPSIVNVTAQVVLGLYFLRSGHQGWLAMAALLLLAAAMLYQMYLTDYFWRRSVGQTGG
jgi:hypothetical protein